MANFKYNILVVDDESEVVETVKSYLTRKGYEVNGARNGEEALKALEQKKTDVLLLDIKMPGIQGTDVAYVVKDKYPDTKIIIFTGYAEKNKDLINYDIIESLLKKPVRLQEIHEKVLEAIANTSVQGINQKEKRARVLTIRAKVVLIEPTAELYQKLEQHFISLSIKGEHYTMLCARNEKELKEIIATQQPNLFLINSAFLKETEIKNISDVLSQAVYPKEITTYNAKEVSELSQAELERLTRFVEATCLMNGLIDIKWVKI